MSEEATLEEQLLEAARDENINKAKELIDAGADVNYATRRTGQTPLIIASTNGNLELVKLFISKGAEIDSKDRYDYTPLIIASHDGRVDIVKELIKHSANVNAADDEEITALMHASEGDHVDVIKILIEAGADIRELNDEGADALIYAAKNGAIKAVKLLLDEGADPYLEDDDGMSPFLHAVFNNYSEIVKLFLEEDIIDPNRRYLHGFTALMYAAIHGHEDTLNVLIEGGADLNRQNDKGMTALMNAVKNEQVEIVKLLLKAGADPEIKDKKGNVALDFVKTKEMRKLFNTEMWKGFTRSDIEKFDTIFGENANNYSCCPVCLKYVERSEACMYMSHRCPAESQYYHEDLYNKYKTPEGVIYWCTICGRIALGHRHHKLRSYDSEFPEDVNKALMPAGYPFENDCSLTNGGGGPMEKIVRFRRLREHALELQEDIGEKEHNEAMDELVEEMWNAPLARKKRTIEAIMREKKWNIPLERFRENVRNEGAAVGPAPNVRRPEGDRDLKPKVLDEGMNFMGEEGRLIQFRHRQPDGSINEHEENMVTKETLKGFIEEKLKEFGTEEFGYCYMYPGECKARLYPEEVKDFLPEEMYEEYRKKFNQKFRGARGGGNGTRKKRKHGSIRISSGATNVFVEAKNAVCALPIKNITRKKSMNGGKMKRKVYTYR